MAQENIDVTVELTDALSRPAKRTEEAIEDLREETDRLNKSLGYTTDSQGRLRDAQGRYVSAAKRAEAVNRRLAGSTDDVGNKTDRLAKLNRVLEFAAGKTSKAMKYFGKVLTLIKFQAVILAVTLLAGAVSALGAAGFAAIAGLSPLVGLLGGLPSLAFAAVQGFAAVKVGLSGVGEGLKALQDGDPEKIAQAFSNLTFEGQDLAYALNDLVNGPLRNIKNRTQQAIAPGFTAALENLRPLLPVIRKGLVQTAGTLGRLAEKASEATDNPLFRGQLRRVMESNEIALARGAKAGGLFALASLAMADAFRPVQREMAAGVYAFADYVNGAVQAGNRTGRLTEFFKDAYDLAKAVGSVIRDLAVALFNTGKQAGVMGDLLGSSLADAAADWRRWTESFEGQHAIRTWFEEAIPVVEQFLLLGRDLASMFGGLANNAEFAPLIAQIRSQLLPAMQQLSGAVSQDLGPALVVAATAFVEFLTFLSASPVADLLMVVASAALQIAENLNSLPGPLKTVAALVVGAALSFGLLSKAFLAIKASALVTAFTRVNGQLSTMAANGNRAAAGIQGIAGKGAGLLGVGMLLGTITDELGRIDTTNVQRSLDALLVSNEFSDDLQTINDDLQKLTHWASGVDKVGGEIATLGGLLGDSTFDKMTENVNAYDEALASMVESGDAERAAEMFKLISANAESMGVSASDVADQFDTYHQAIKTAEDTRMAAIMDTVTRATEGLTDEQRRNAGATEFLTGAQRQQYERLEENRRATERATTSTEEQRRKTDALRSSLIKLNETLIGQRRSYIGFRQTVADSREELAKGELTLDSYTQAGRDNELALLDVAEAASSITDAAERTKAIEEAKRFITNWADAAGMGRREAAKYADSLFVLRTRADELPPSAKIDLSVSGYEAAYNALTSVTERMEFIKNNPQLNIDIPLGPYVTDVPARNRKDGGAVWTGVPFQVGERGPELFVGSSGAMSVIGAAGVEKRTFSEPGWVLPNSVYERTVVATPAPAASVNVTAAAAPPAVAAPVRVPAVAAAAPAGGGSAPRESRDTDLADWPDVHVHLHGDTGLTVADAEAAAVRAVRRLERERNERGY